MELRKTPTKLGTLLGVILALTNCDEADQSATAAASASAPIARASAHDSTRPAEAAAPPPAKEYAAATADALGTLPQGIGVKAGEQAPDAELEDFHGTKVSLAKLWAKGPVLLIFYRGGWCPFCNFQVRSLAQAYPDFQKRGVTPALISVDRPSEATKTRASYAITFPVLSDPDLVAHRAYRVLQQVDDSTLAKYKAWGIDLEKSSGRSHHTIAVPAIFLIGETGVILWAHADRDYKVRPTNEQLLSALDGVLK